MVLKSKIAKLNTEEKSFFKYQTMTSKLNVEFLKKLKLRQERIFADLEKNNEFKLKKRNEKNLKDVILSLADYKLVGKMRKQ